MTNRELLVHELVEDEGIKLKTYPGPVTGEPHTGIGHLLSQAQSDEELEIMGLDEELDDWYELEITEDQAYKLLDVDINDAIESLAPTWTPQELDEMDGERYIALLSMAFQVGGFGVQRKFPSFVKAVKAQDWDRASKEMLWSNGLKMKRRSAWYKQTPTRCQAMADRMRHGTITSETPLPSLSDEPPNLNAYTERELLEELLQRTTNRSPQQYG